MMLDEILVWSDSLPAWQRDALRRLVTQGKLSPTDLDEVTALCVRPHFTAARIDPARDQLSATPLAASDLPASGALGESVSLKSVRHVKDVNALKPGETLTFSPHGMTIVFGTNGSGKSGYTRILKRACRARGTSAPVLANAVATPTQSQGPALPEAIIEAIVGSADIAVTWQDGTSSSDANLAGVSVFDSISTDAYVSNKNDIAFRPFGLDLFDRLGEVMRRVKSALEERRSRDEVSALPIVPPGASRLLGLLSAATDLGKICLEAAFTDADTTQLTSLRQDRARVKLNDPQKRAKELRAHAARVESLDEELESIRRRAIECHAAIKLLVASSKSVPGTSGTNAANTSDAEAPTAPQLPLSASGSPLWREMWGAAAKFGEGAVHVGHDFPHTIADVPCLLCQQILDKQAAARLQALRSLFDTGSRQPKTRARVDANIVAEQKRAITSLRVSSLVVNAVDELRDLDPALHVAAAAFVDSVVKLQTICLAHLEEVTADDQKEKEQGLGAVAALDDEHLPSSPPSLAPLIASMTADAARLDQTEETSDREAALTARIDELEAREWVSSHEGQLIDEVQRLRRIAAYDECLKETRTTSLSAKSSELTKRYVTEALASSFEAELKKLGFERHPLELSHAGAQAGNPTHQIRLKGSAPKSAKATHPLSAIVSEGEARCIALAAFLAELGTAAHRSGIIFDDPVSSLDHEYRLKVAQRLVEEATARQVVVFTHDLAFMFEIVRLCELRKTIPFAARSLTRDGFHAGLVEDELPWRGKSTNRKIGWLRLRQQEIAALERKPGTKQERERLTIEAYAKMRQTWERAVEEVLFNGAVERFKNKVQTKNVKPIRSDEIAALDAGMTKCSKFEGGHDHSLEDDVEVPTPRDLLADIEHLASWVATLKKR